MAQTFLENTLKAFQQNTIVFNNTLDKISDQKIAITGNSFNSV